ncbi:MAG: PD40 domain-containing protein [Oscillospiraceae bacterium]|nr:PD40 domain-containing protein [Oscillospiraceae bacterium]
MNCPVCGASNAPDSKFCCGCGNTLPAQSAAPVPPTVPVNPTGYGAPVQQVSPTGYGAPVQQVPPTGYGQPVPPTGYGAPPKPPKAPKEKVNIDFTEVKDRLVDTVKPVGTVAKGVWSNKKARIGIIAGALLLITLSILCAIFFGGNGYIEAEESIRMLRTGNNEYSIVVGNKVLDDTVSDYDYLTRTMNGKVAAFTNDGELYVVKDSKLKDIADDVVDYELSVNGEYIAYSTKDDALYVAKTGDGKSEKICDDTEGNNYGFRISPDGKSIAYREGEAVKLYRDKKSTEITDNKYASVYGLSNSGNQIYVSIYQDDHHVLYSYNNKGDKTKLGEIDELAGFNDSFSQVLFYNDGKTYIAKDGKEANKIHSSELELVPTEKCDAHGDAYPVSNLYDHVYYNGKNDVYLVKEKDCIKLVSKASQLQLDGEAKYLYYIYDGREVRCIEIAKGEKASESAVTIVDESVAGYVVTSDRKYVYYLDGSYLNLGNITLKCVDGKKGGKSTTIDDDINANVGFAISNQNRIYYVMDGDLYVVSNGKTGKKILSDIKSLSNTTHGDVYASDGDAWYGSTGDEKLKELVEID